MNSEDPTFLQDWLAISLRWLVLLGMALALAAGESLSGPVLLIFLLGAVWNLALTTLTALGRRLPAQHGLSLAGDLLIGFTLFYFSGGVEGQLVWAGVLPIITAALFFGLPGVVWATAGNLIVQGALAYLMGQMPAVLLLIVTLLPLYLIAGLLLGYTGGRIRRIVQDRQAKALLSRRDLERKQRERRSAIYKLVSAMSATLNYQRVLETALDLSASALARPDGAEEAIVSAVLLYRHNGNEAHELRVATARRFTPADARLSLPGTSGLIGRTIDEGEPRFSKGILSDPELSRVAALQNCQAAYCLPLRHNLNTYGALLFGHPDPEFFSAERREVLDIIGNQAVIAMQNAQLYHDLELEKERMLEIQEEARKKLARDLHDGPTQTVAALAMRANFARRLIERDVNAAADELYKMEDLARRATQEIRHMLFTLRPLVLETQGLVPALVSMTEKMRETYGQNVTISADPEVVSRLEAGKQGVIFYIVEEAVSNARKHARAGNIWVRLKDSGDGLVIVEVEDNGVGFNLGQVDSSYEKRGSLGLVNMRERTELVNGVLQIESAEGRGTRIRVLIPSTEQAADRLRGKL
jgi:signal transduction histidine kinase